MRLTSFLAQHYIMLTNGTEQHGGTYGATYLLRGQGKECIICPPL